MKRTNNLSKQPRKKQKGQLRNLLSTLLAIVTFGLLFYPIVANYFMGQQNVKSVEHYVAAENALSKAKTQTLLAQARTYNQYIYDCSSGLVWKRPIPDYQRTLAVDDTGMMGYLSIPQLALRDVPIYHGDRVTTLAIGIGHLPQTSLPIGGINTHAVLSAHSGRLNNTLFTNLDKLKKGDAFYLRVLNEHLKYEVNRIQIVAPNQVSSLNVVKGQDLVTLVTCYPTGINNERLLVTGRRVPYAEKLLNEKIMRNRFGYDFWVMAGSALLALAGDIFLLSHQLDRRKLYQVGQPAVGTPELARQQSGDFGKGLYLTNSKKLAKDWAKEAQAKYPEEEVVLHLYRLENPKELSRWIFRSKGDNWKQYLKENAQTDVTDEKHGLVVGPVSRGGHTFLRKSLQYRFSTQDALNHLKYLKTIKVKPKPKEGGML